MENEGQHRNGTEVGCGNANGNDLADDQVSTAEQQSQSGKLTDGAGAATKEHIQ